MAYAIMGCAKRVHATLGFGFLESAYGDAMEIEFAKAGIPYAREDPVRIYYDDRPLPTVWRADFTCFDRAFIVELKAIKAITKIEWAQVMHYLRATRVPHALLINFGRPTLQYDVFDLDKLQPKALADSPGTCGEAAASNVPMNEKRFCGAKHRRSGSGAHFVNHRSSSNDA